MNKKLKLTVNMHCATCAGNITKALKNECELVNANFALGIVKVEFDGSKTNEEKIIKKINDIGYEVTDKE